MTATPVVDHPGVVCPQCMQRRNTRVPEWTNR